MHHSAEPSSSRPPVPSDLGPAELEARCRSLFVDRLDYWAGSLAFEDHDDAIDAEDLADKAVFDDLLGRFAQEHPGADRHAVISLWSQAYFARLTIATTALCLASACPLPLDFERLKVRFCPHRGTPLCFHLRCGGAARSAEVLVKALYDEQVAVMVGRLKRHSGLSARLFWENAGSYGIWILGEIARTQPDLAPTAERLLGDAAWPRAGCAMLPQMKCAAREARACSRRVCCLRYRLPGFSRCAETCPLPAAPEFPHRDERLNSPLPCGEG